MEYKEIKWVPEYDPELGEEVEHIPEETCRDILKGFNSGWCIMLCGTYGCSPEVFYLHGNYEPDIHPESYSENIRTEIENFCAGCSHDAHWYLNIPNVPDAMPDEKLQEIRERRARFGLGPESRGATLDRILKSAYGENIPETQEV